MSMVPQFTSPKTTFSFLIAVFVFSLWVSWSALQESQRQIVVYETMVASVDQLLLQIMQARGSLEAYINRHDSNLLSDIQQRIAHAESLKMMLDQDHFKTISFADFTLLKQTIADDIQALKALVSQRIDLADAHLNPIYTAEDSSADQVVDAIFQKMIADTQSLRLQLSTDLTNDNQTFSSNTEIMLLINALLMLIALVGLLSAERNRQQALDQAKQADQKRENELQKFDELFEFSPVSLWLEDFSGVKAAIGALQAQGVNDVEAYCKAHPELMQSCVEQVKIIKVNQACLALPCLALHGAASKEELYAGLQKTFTSSSYQVFQQEVIMLMQGRNEMTHKAQVKKLSGEVVDVLVSVKVLPGHEELLGNVLVAVVDLSESEASRRALEQSKSLLSQAQRIAKIGSWELDVATGKLVWSEEIFGIFEVDANQFEASYTAFLALLGEEERARVQQEYAQSLAHHTPYEATHKLYFADGRIKYIIERAEHFYDANGMPQRSVGTVQDVTSQVVAHENERARDEKMQHVQRLESLGVLAGGIAHDFNNLLTVIMGNASLASNHIDDANPALRHVVAIEKTSQKAANLCQQMLAYSGQGQFIVKPVNLSMLVEDMTQLLHVSIAKNIVLRLNLPKQISAVDADVTQMQQVIMNLVINASEAIGSNSGAISIATGMSRVDKQYLASVFLDEGLAEGRYVYLEVSDTGCGMDEKTRIKMFEPFFTTKFTGRGLGMAAVLGIVRGHQGAMKVYSEVGKGSTFKILLPASAEPVQDLSLLPDIKDWRASGCVLVVDDEETLREVASAMLEQMGFEVLTAEDGVEGVAMYQTHQARITLVLLDMTMPRMGGEEAFSHIRSINPNAKVLLSSGYNQQDATNRFAGKGLAGFIQKPYFPEDLAKKLQEVLAS